MTFTTDARSTRASLIAGLTGLLAFIASSVLYAQTVTTVNGVDITQDVFDTYLESRLRKPATEASADERANALSELQDIYFLTTQSRAKELANNARTKAQIELQSRGILAQAVASDFLTSNQATDEEIQAAYNEQIALAPPLEYKARHILVESQGEATGLITELQGGGDFIELAKEKSTGPSGPNGGDLGWFSSNQMVAPFSQAVADLEDGEFTKAPVQTQFGWHVILREDSRQTTPPTLESVREVVKQRVEQQKLQKYIAKLRKPLAE